MKRFTFLFAVEFVFAHCRKSDWVYHDYGPSLSRDTTQQFYLSWQDNDIMFTGGQIYSSKDADSANASMLILDNGKYQVTLHLKRSGSGIVYDNSDGSYFEFKKSQATLCYSNNIGVGDLQIVDSALDVKSGQMRYKGRYYIAAFPLYDLAGKPNTVQGSFLNMALLAN